MCDDTSKHDSWNLKTEVCGVTSTLGNTYARYLNALEQKSGQISKSYPPLMPHTCHVCKHQFNRLSHYQDHVAMHSCEKPFKCSICDEGFSRADSLRDHTRIHTGNKPHKCDVCGARFSRLQTLKRHMI